MRGERAKSSIFGTFGYMRSISVANAAGLLLWRVTEAKITESD